MRRFVWESPGAVGLQGPCDYLETQYDKQGHRIGDAAESDWLSVTPWGFRNILNWVNNRSVALQMKMRTCWLPALPGAWHGEACRRHADCTDLYQLACHAVPCPPHAATCMHACEIDWQAAKVRNSACALSAPACKHKCACKGYHSA